MSQVAGFYTSVDDSLGKAVMIEATKRAHQAERRLKGFKSWSWSDYDTFVTWMIWEDDKQANFLAIGKAAREKGAAAPSQVVLSRGPPLEIALRMAASASFRVVDHAGGISGLGSLIAEDEEAMRSWHIYNPSILTANFQKPGNFGRINGELDSGKTNTFCVLCEQWFSENPLHVCISNVRMFKPVERYIYAAKASALLRAIATLPNDVIFIFGMDEGGLNYSKPDQITTHVRQLDKLMRLIRKFHGSFVLIEQREESVPNLIMEWARNIYTCHKAAMHGIMTIELRGPALGFRDTIKQFPKSKLPFDTDDPAAFDWDIDVIKLHEAIAGKENPKEEILAYLDREAQERGTLPRLCGYPGCKNEFISPDKRRRFCDEHITINRNRTTSHVAEIESKKASREEAKLQAMDDFTEEKPKSVDDFLS